MLASSLHLIVAQRLVRLTCERCAEPYEPEPIQLRALGISGLEHQFRRGVGCSSCRKSGYVGRRGVYEVMQITPPVAKLIESKASEATIRAQARQDGMKLLPEHAVEILRSDATTPEEVLRVVDIAEEETEAKGLSCLNCGRAVEEAFSMCPHCGTPLQCKCGSCGNPIGRFARSVASPRAARTPRHPGLQRRKPLCLQPQHRRHQRGPETRQYRALVVDDTADFRRLISFTLEHSGLPVSVETASNGREAIEKAQADPPDFIVLDIMMPEMDGFEVCERLRANVRTAFVPILMLTALDDAANRACGFLAGTDDYIGKPFARAELLARVRRLIERTYGTSLPTRTEVTPGGRMTSLSAAA
jgi:CheY-like chemotaxis protein